MYDPKIRLVILIYTIVIIWATSSAIYSYFLGETGLDWATHIKGIITIGGSIFGGFTFVWLCSQFMTFSKHRKTGFEATYVDETGTGFNFPVSLSKFMPDVVVHPYDDTLSPLEAELFGFLNAYRHWPYDITGKNKESLYEHACKQWAAMKSLPEATDLHRAAALAQDLSLVYAYNEKRKTYPYWQIWKKDDVRFTRKCLEHGGLSAVLLATFPAFRALGHNPQTNQRFRRALLTAIRYRDNPTSIPANCDPLARELYEALHKSAQKAAQTSPEMADFNPTAEDVERFNGEISMYLQGTIRELELNPVDINENHDGVYLGDGNVLVSVPKLLKHFNSVFSPTTRGVFHLWNLDEQEHPTWTYMLETLKSHNLLLTKWDDVEKEDGIFNVSVSGVDFEHAAFLNISLQAQPDLRSSLDSLPKWNGIINMEHNPTNLLDEVKEKAKAVDNMIQRVYDEPVLT